MSLTDKDLDALRTLIHEELVCELEPFRSEVNVRFSEVLTQIEGLYQRDEKREQEYLFMSSQIKRLDERVTVIEEKIS